MPDPVMTAMARLERLITLGANHQMTGSARTPKKAVKTISTAVSLCRKYLSTRYLSIWVDMAQRTGPEKAKTSHIRKTLAPLLCTCAQKRGGGPCVKRLLLRDQDVGHRRARRGAGVDHQSHRQMHRRAARCGAAIMRGLARDDEAAAGRDLHHRHALHIAFK